jgi:lactoylglutathione lyase
MIEYEVDHIHLFATDLEATARWYRDVLGAEIVESLQSDGVPRIDIRLGALHLYLADGPRVEAALGEQLGAAPTGMHYGLDHFGLRVKDVDAAVARLRQHGVQVTFGPKTLRPGARAAYIEAPDGVSIEILSRDLALDARPAPNPRFALQEATA